MSEALQGRLEGALGSGYRIERELGGGGMSRVFLAEEVALKRRVVVKVLPPEMAAGVNQDRFRREIELAAGLQHPHVVPVLTAGSSGDLLWYTMPFIEGESLRTRLARQGDLPVKEAVHILREVADALAHAHRKGVVHRDIKPDNIMLSGRHALVTDFGVAKAVSESTGGSSLTSMGLALGTPSYMAPEQASAEPGVDQRADIYAFGATAYEMLAGRPPFTGFNAQAVLAAHVMQDPQPIESLRPTIPPALAALVMRCLEKRASDRWQEADEMIPHLEALLTPSGGSVPAEATLRVQSSRSSQSSQSSRIIGIFAVVSILVLALVWGLVQSLGLPDWVVFAAGALLLAGVPIMINASRGEHNGRLGRLGTVRGAIIGGVLAFLALAVTTGGFMALRAQGIGPFATLMTAGALKEKDRVLVADFENHAADSLLGASVTEALRIDLTRSPVMRVLEPAEVDQALARMQRKAGSAVTAEAALELAQREGVGAVVAGEIATLGAGFSISARVLSADGTTLLAERETAADASELIGAVDRLSRKLRSGVGESLKTIRAGEPLEQVTTGSLNALRAYTQGIAASRRGAHEEAGEFLREAIRHDSAFASAWRGLAVVYANTFQGQGFVRDAASKAYQYRDRLPEYERLLVTAVYYQAVSYNGAALIDTYRQALALRPEDRVALGNLALELTRQHRYAEAEILQRKSLALFPTNTTSYLNLAGTLERQGKLAAADSVIEAAGKNIPATLTYLQMQGAMGLSRMDTARALRYADSMLARGDTFRKIGGYRTRAVIYESKGQFQRGRRERLNAASTLASVRDAAGAIEHVAWQASIDAEITGKSDGPQRLVDSALRAAPMDSIPELNRPWLPLAEFYYRAGNIAEGDRAFARVDQSRLGGTFSLSPDWVAGVGKLMSGKPAEALALFRKAHNFSFCDRCALGEIGQAFEELGQPDSAIAAYEELRTMANWGDVTRPRQLGPVSYRLGELYEGKGDKAKAIERYSQFVELWREAEPALQPRVAEAKKRIAQLTAEPM